LLVRDFVAAGLDNLDVAVARDLNERVDVAATRIVRRRRTVRAPDFSGGIARVAVALERGHLVVALVRFEDAARAHDRQQIPFDRDVDGFAPPRGRRFRRGAARGFAPLLNREVFLQRALFVFSFDVGEGRRR